MVSRSVKSSATRACSGSRRRTRSKRSPPTKTSTDSLQVDLAPRLRRIEMALMRDADLFPSGGNLFPESLTNAVLRPSLQTRSAAYKDALKGGWTVANEVRGLENLPPKEGGDELQQTPVGGAPNPTATQGDTNE